ncbi:hypothetical protein [Oceanirhabdus sp. W0125-5]|uniref:hypothetical protein n=1 Tax=Oceanirhabdus sp. W0125-5 TaxID=2999116 RepID=UPI0022F33499|nr:hypothetical protein [Oceanirhabdus sp. W0125-5]WBW98155.1 hypothetical protein OW730_05150 [Oceanirhabdus sp. W0125-5]
MDELFGVKGRSIADGKNTKGRKAVEWTLLDRTKIKWEGHPYDNKTVNDRVHVNRHWHIRRPGASDYDKGFPPNIPWEKLFN